MEINSILSALKQEASSSLFEVYLPTLKKVIAFRPITVGEQKTLSKMLMNNPNEKNAYKMLLALIKDVCLDKDFDVLSLAEIDRVKILLEFYSYNYFTNAVDLTCTNYKCEKTFKYDLNFKELASRIDKLDVEDKVFQYTTGDGKITAIFTIGFPRVNRVADFKDSDLGVAESDDDITRMTLNQEEMFKLLVKKLSYTRNDPALFNFDVDLSEYSVTDGFKILENLPFEMFFSDKGLLPFTIKNYIEPIIAISVDAVCPHCKEVNAEVFNLQSFFI